MTERRIIDQAEATFLSGEDFLIADNANLGTRKISFERLLSGATPLPPNYITGLEISRVDNSSFTVSPGYARSMDNVRNAVLNNSLTKNLSQTFALGNAGCMPDSLTVQQNTKYYVFALVNAGGLVDIIVDTDVNCENGLADTVVISNNFNKYALIGEIQTASDSTDIFRIESYSVKMTMQDVLDISVKPGAIIPWAGTDAPYGYLVCNGAEISRTTYADLFDAIGTTWGTGDGATTFNIPNFNGKFLQGGTVGTYNSQTLPNLKGGADIFAASSKNSSPSGVFGSTQSTPNQTTSTTSNNSFNLEVPNFNAHNYSSIYQDGARVQPDNAEILYVIKY